MVPVAARHFRLMEELNYVKRLFDLQNLKFLQRVGMYHPCQSRFVHVVEHDHQQIVRKEVLNNQS